MRPAALVPGVRAHRRRVLPLLQRDRHRPQREGLARQGPRAQQQGGGQQHFYELLNNNEIGYYSVFYILSCEQYRLITQLLSIDVAHVSWGKRFRSCHSIRLKLLHHPLFHVTGGIIYLPQLNFSDLRISHF